MDTSLREHMLADTAAQRLNPLDLDNHQLVRTRARKLFAQNNNRTETFFLLLEHAGRTDYRLTAMELDDRFNHRDMGIRCSMCHNMLDPEFVPLFHIVNSEWDILGDRVLGEVAKFRDGQFEMMSSRYAVGVRNDQKDFYSLQIFDTFYGNQRTLKINGHFPPNTSCSHLQPLNSELFLFVHIFRDDICQTSLLYLVQLCTRTRTCSILQAIEVKGCYQFLIPDPDNSLRFVIAFDHQRQYFYRLVQIMNANMEFGPRIADDRLNQYNSIYRLSANKIYGLFYGRGVLQEQQDVHFKEFKLNDDRMQSVQTRAANVQEINMYNLRSQIHFWLNKQCFLLQETDGYNVQFYKFNCQTQVAEKIKLQIAGSFEKLRYFDEDGFLSVCGRKKKQHWFRRMPLRRPDYLSNLALSSVNKITSLMDREAYNNLLLKFPSKWRPFEGFINIISSP